MTYNQLEIQNKNVLLLQGPMSFYFRKLRKILLENNAKSVQQISFNGGDYIFSNKKYNTNYRGSFTSWGRWLENFLFKNEIGVVFVYGGDREYHRHIRNILKKSGVKLYVLEEGYIRPNYITLEENGVNGNSTVLESFNSLVNKRVIAKPVDNLPSHTFEMFFFATVYSVFMKILHPFFLNYNHHKQINLYQRTVFAFKSLAYRESFKKRDQRVMSNLWKLKTKYYFVPLQVHDDFQVKTHSKYNSIESFIKEVVDSFAEHAPKKSVLVIKHHPMDRGIKEYRNFIRGLAVSLDIKERIIFIHEGSIPSILRNSVGCITINSTVGLSSIYHKVKTKVMGKSLYKLEGCHFSDSLDLFWKTPFKVDSRLFFNFYAYLKEKTQINDSFYL